LNSGTEARTVAFQVLPVDEIDGSAVAFADGRHEVDVWPAAFAIVTSSA
jgi:hypothetical protein